MQVRKFELQPTARRFRIPIQQRRFMCRGLVSVFFFFFPTVTQPHTVQISKNLISKLSLPSDFFPSSSFHSVVLESRRRREAPLPSWGVFQPNSIPAWVLIGPLLQVRVRTRALARQPPKQPAREENERALTGKRLPEPLGFTHCNTAVC